MIVSAAISRINYVLRGTDEDAPESGTDEWNYWVDTLNRKKDELYRDVSKQWRSSYDVESLGTVTANATPSYNLPTTFLGASSYVYVVTTDGNRHDFEICQPQERDSRKQQVFIAGMNPQVLYFTDEILATDQIVGGTLYMPGYYLPADMTTGTDTLPVDDPNWLCAAGAAEIAFNDLVYEDKATDLNAKANNLYSLMVKNNARGTYANPRNRRDSIPTNLRRSRY